MQTTILSEEQAKSFKKKFTENTFVPIDDFVEVGTLRLKNWILQEIKSTSWKIKQN